MAYTVTEIRKAIADTITDCLDDVTGHAHVPTSIMPPAVIVRPESAQRSAMGRGTVSYTFRLVVAAASVDTISAQDTLDGLRATVGEASLFAVIDDNRTLGLDDTDASADGWSNYGVSEIAEHDYLTADIGLVVHTKGV